MNITFPLILDGATGTQLLKKGMTHGVCSEQWILEHPDIAADIQKAYVHAGSQVIYAPTFGANSINLENHGINGLTEKYNISLTAISRSAADGKALIAGDISSVGRMLYPMGDMHFEDFYTVYLEQVQALEKAGVDLFVIETMTSVPEARAAVLAVKAVSSKPVFVSFSCDENGRTMMGTDVCAALLILQGMGVDAFGLNCSTGPAEMLEQIRRLRKYSSVPLIAKPNAGLPQVIDGKTVYSVNAKDFTAYVPDLVDAGVSIFGACCGSDESFIAALKEALEGISVKEPSPASPELLPCATEKDVFLLNPDITVDQVFSCDEDLEDNIYDLDTGEVFGIEIVREEDLPVFADAQYAIRNPLCLFCNHADLLEKVLRAYQGRALYKGMLSSEELKPLVEKYGLIV